MPKVLNSVELCDFRSISVVGCVYKLLAKILPNRLKVDLPHIISPSQGDFVRNRQILDNVLIANELIDSRKRSKKVGVILKIDMEVYLFYLFFSVSQWLSYKVIQIL